MAIHKLVKGDVLPFIVTAIERDVPATNAKYGPSHKFVGRTATDPDAAVFMHPASAVRQLERIGLTLDTAVGQAIAFARPGEYVDINRYTPPGATAPAPVAPAPVPVQAPLAPAFAPPPAALAPVSNAKQPFSSGPYVPGLDPEPAPVAVAAPAAPAAPAEAPPAADPRLHRMFAVYDACFDHAARTSKRLAATGAALSHEGLAAQTATLFIEACKKGLTA